MTIVSGATTGFLGLPGMAIDVPITTTVIMRSIAEIAPSKGEDLASEEVKRECLLVLAFGDPAADNDDLDVGYWSVRAALTHTAIDFLIKRAAAQFGITLTEKILAQAVPVVGAVAGLP